MTHEQILTDAINQALKNGWKPCDLGDTTEVKCYETGCWIYCKDGDGCYFPFEQLLFSQDHEFFKKLYGEKPVHIRNIPDVKDKDGNVIARAKGFYTDPNWQYHLQQCIISDDYITYLDSTRSEWVGGNV